MKLYIDKIDDKSIHIKQIGINGSILTDYNNFATFEAGVGNGGTVTINKIGHNGVSFSAQLSELYINGTLAPQNMNDAIKALVFIGSFKNGGGASGQTPVGGVESVTGNIVDNTDKKNPVVNMPTLDKSMIFATKGTGADLVYINDKKDINNEWNSAAVSIPNNPTESVLRYIGGNSIILLNNPNVRAIINPISDSRKYSQPIVQGTFQTYDTRVWYNKNIDVYLYAGSSGNHSFMYSLDNNITGHKVNTSSLSGGYDEMDVIPYKNIFRIVFMGNANSNGKIYDFDPFTETFTDTGIVYATPSVNGQFRYFEDINVLLLGQYSNNSVYVFDINKLNEAGTNIAPNAIWMNYASMIRPDWTCRVGDYFYFFNSQNGTLIGVINLKTFEYSKITIPTFSGGNGNPQMFRMGNDVYFMNSVDLHVYKINRETLSYELFWNNPNQYKLFCVVGSGIGNEILVNNNTGLPAGSGVSLNDVALKKDLGFQIPEPPSTGVFTLQVTDGVANWIV